MVEAMTVEEFEEQYARRSGVTVEWLHEHGRYGAPCDCDSDICEGFQMAHRCCEAGYPSDGYHPKERPA